MQLPRTDTPNSQTIDLSKCSSFNVKSHNTRNLFPQNTNRYCLSGNNDTILNFTKKDLIYLNELINNNNADEKILQEKNIIAPQEIQQRSIFCPDQTKTIFWPNVTNIQDMCQEKNVVAVATLTPTDGKIFYKVGNEVKEKKIDIQNTSGFYGGTLQIDAELQSILSNSKAQTPSTNIRTPVIPFLLYNKDHTYSLGCPKGTEDSEKWHCGDG